MPRLLIISSAPVAARLDNIYLDRKFYEGVTYYKNSYHGDVSCLLFKTDNTIPFSICLKKNNLPFDLLMRDDSIPIINNDLLGYDVILASGDNHRLLDLPGMTTARCSKIFYTIEYTLSTRIQIIFLSRGSSFLKKAYSILWTLVQERRRRKAFRQANGLQANGYPAFNAYRKINSNIILYLDNRMKKDMLVTGSEMAHRRRRLTAGEPVRLIHSGRLEPMKGAQDLIKVALGLVDKNIEFELNIFGTGSLYDSINQDIMKHGLESSVRLHGAVDFERELVPFARTNADIFLSCHRQSDPSCTYLESMGCGLAIAGYDNAMWVQLCRESRAGWTAGLGRTDELVDIIAGASRNPGDVIEKCEAARDMAEKHLFENEFALRMRHLCA